MPAVVRGGRRQGNQAPQRGSAPRGGGRSRGGAAPRFDPEGYGAFIEVEHPNGMTTLYGHLSRVDVAQGDAVTPGQRIGLVGSTGYSTGPHLHFEVRRNGGQINPTKVMDRVTAWPCPRRSRVMSASTRKAASSGARSVIWLPIWQARPTGVTCGDWEAWA